MPAPTKSTKPSSITLKLNTPDSTSTEDSSNIIELDPSNLESTQDTFSSSSCSKNKFDLQDHLSNSELFLDWNYFFPSYKMMDLQLHHLKSNLSMLSTTNFSTRTTTYYQNIFFHIYYSQE